MMVDRSRTSGRRRTARERSKRHRADFPDLVVGEWWCPVCGQAAHRTARPGRPKVYCSNACRQRAYRIRRARRDQHVLANSNRPMVRSGAHLVRGSGKARSHALRPSPDLVTSRFDVRNREVTVCGAFARRARPGHPVLGGHDRFVDAAERSCRTCLRLTGVGRPADP